MKRLLVASLTLLALFASPALSQGGCGPRDAIIAWLADEYGETIRSRGLAGERVLEIFASSESGTWTIIMTLPSGMSCLMAHGSHYDDVEAIPGEPM